MLENDSRSSSVAFVLRICCVLLVLWFMPWVWTFYLGFIAYFPYEPDGKSRYVRITGPLLGLLDDDIWVFSKDIPKICKNAVVAAEDGKFYEHHGLDLESIDLALEKNHRAKKPRWGASTITQQLVKNAFLHRRRSYLRKAREIVGAVMLDAIMSKDCQLTWYFNVVEFGPRIYGLHDAAHYYFRKKPAQLSSQECVQLVSLLPSPNRSGRFIKNQTTSPALERRTERIMRALSHANNDVSVR